MQYKREMYDSSSSRASILSSHFYSSYYVSNALLIESGLSYDPTLEATNCDGIETVIHSIGTTRNPMHTCLLTQTILHIALMYRTAIVLFPCLSAHHKIPQSIISICVACIDSMVTKLRCWYFIELFECNRSALLKSHRKFIKSIGEGGGEDLEREREIR